MSVKMRKKPHVERTPFDRGFKVGWREAIADFVRRVEEQEFNCDTLCTDCSNGYTLKQLFDKTAKEMGVELK